MDRQLDITLKEYLDMQHAELMREVLVTQKKQDATNGRLLAAETRMLLVEKDIIRLQERADGASVRGMAGIGTGVAAAGLWLWERFHS